MTMAFCRGCGKEIHDSAPSCPHCGAPQAGSSNSSTPGWPAIVAIILAGLVFLGSLDFNPRDKDEVAGIFAFSTVSIALAAINLHQTRPGRNLSIIAIVFAALSLLICFGRLH